MAEEPLPTLLISAENRFSENLTKAFSAEPPLLTSALIAQKLVTISIKFGHNEDSSLATHPFRLSSLHC